jgi:hypothetical protein
MRPSQLCAATGRKSIRLTGVNHKPLFLQNPVACASGGGVLFSDLKDGFLLFTLIKLAPLRKGAKQLTIFCACLVH